MKKKVPPPLVSKKALDKAMEESIEKYMNGEVTLPGLLVRAKSTAKARAVLSEYAGDSLPLTKGKAVFATLDGEDYSHWQKFAIIILKGLGYKIVNMGSGVPANEVVQSVKDESPDILGITAPSTSLIPEFNVMSSMSSKVKIKKLIDTLSEEECRENITILIGGNVPVVHSAADVGADYCCKNLLQTIKLMEKLASSSNKFPPGAFAVNSV
jgi:5-methyltetrahydrofolate--homocysteine methyltransferase